MGELDVLKVVSYFQENILMFTTNTFYLLLNFTSCNISP